MFPRADADKTPVQKVELRHQSRRSWPRRRLFRIGILSLVGSNEPFAMRYWAVGRVSWVISLGGDRSRGPIYVRSTSNRVEILCSAVKDAKCHNRTNAPQ